MLSRTGLPRVNPAGGSFHISRDGSRLAFTARTLRTHEISAIDNVAALVTVSR
jgi:hypothetical protein